MPTWNGNFEVIQASASIIIRSHRGFLILLVVWRRPCTTTTTPSSTIWYVLTPVGLLSLCHMLPLASDYLLASHRSEAVLITPTSPFDPFLFLNYKARWGGGFLLDSSQLQSCVHLVLCTFACNAFHRSLFRCFHRRGERSIVALG